MASESDADGLVPADRESEILSALYVVFGALWAVSLYLDRAPISPADLPLFDWLLFVAAASAFAVGVLGLSSPDRFGVDDPSRWQFLIMGIAVVLVSFSVLFQLTAV